MRGSEYKGLLGVCEAQVSWVVILLGFGENLGALSAANRAT